MRVEQLHCEAAFGRELEEGPHAGQLAMLFMQTWGGRREGGVDGREERVGVLMRGSLLFLNEPIGQCI